MEQICKEGEPLLTYVVNECEALISGKHWADVLVRELASGSERMEMFSLVFSGFYIYYCLYVTSGDTSVPVTEHFHYKQRPVQSLTHVT